MAKKKETISDQIELDIEPIKKPSEVIAEKGLVIPEDRIYVVLDTGTRRAKYVSTTGAYGCFLNIAGTPINESARAKIGMDYAIGNLVGQHPGRFVETADAHTEEELKRAYEKFKMFDNGVLKPDEESKKKALFLLEYVIGQSVAKNDKDKEVWLVLTVPPGTTGARERYYAICDLYNQKQSAEGTGRKLPFIFKRTVRSQPDLLGKGLNYEYSLDCQSGAGTQSGEVSFGIDKEENDKGEKIEAPYTSTPKAGDWADQLFFASVKEKYPHAVITLDDVRKIKEARGFVGASQSSVELKIGTGHLRRASYDVTDCLRNVCEQQAKVLASEVIVKVLDDPALTMDLRSRIVEHVVCGGGGSAIRGLQAYVTGLVQPYYENANIEVLEDKVFGECNNSLPYIVSNVAERKIFKDK